MEQQVKDHAYEDAEAKAQAANSSGLSRYSSTISPPLPATVLGDTAADTAADKPPEADDIKEEDWVELRDILLGWESFGLFCIFMTHPLRSRQDYFMKMLPLLLLVAQLLIPSFLFASAFANYDQGLCPGTGSTEIKVLQSALAV
eukprot:scaffold15140_cov63-Phaeocystis_antarctica.AAC.1